MVNIHVAYTSPVNPSGASPVLTQPQVWAGLQRKVRFAQEFVPVLESCTVLEENNGVVRREVKFKEGAGPKARSTEIVRNFWPSWVDFEQEDGSNIRNVISDGPGGPEDLHLMFAFEYRLPQVAEGSPEAENELQRIRGMSKKSVESSINAIRQMVVDGRIVA